MTRTASILRNVSVLEDLSDDLLEQLERALTEVHVPAGTWVLREGDSADSMFIVSSGRLEAVAEGPPEQLLRVLRRGDVVGELALLSDGVRAASVRARRDSELLEIGRDAFETLIRETPTFALGLARTLGAQLAASRSPLTVATLPRTIAVVGLDAGAPVAAVAEGLADALAAHGSVARLADGDLARIDRAERSADRLILRGGITPEDPWTDLCLREADLVLAVSSSGVPDPAWHARATALHGCELLVLGSEVSDTVVAQVQAQDVRVLDSLPRGGREFATIARRLTGRSLGVVLSGGGARALAHLGVLEELQAAGLSFDRFAGVSLGSVVAAALAADFGPEAIFEWFERGFVATNPTNDFAFPAYSLIRGAKTRRLLHAAFGDRRVEALPRRFFSVSCDLVQRESVLHRTGLVADAVYASLSIPGVFPPIATPDGRLLVDGGVLDNLPVSSMARTGEGPVVAVDVTGRMGNPGGLARPRLAALARAVRLAMTGSEAAIPRVGETILRTVLVGSIDTVAAARRHADVVITPAVDGIGLMDWTALPQVVELGRQAAREALAANPILTGDLGR